MLFAQHVSQMKTYPITRFEDSLCSSEKAQGKTLMWGSKSDTLPLSVLGLYHSRPFPLSLFLLWISLSLSLSLSLSYLLYVSHIENDPQRKFKVYIFRPASWKS